MSLCTCAETPCYSSFPGQFSGSISVTMSRSSQQIDGAGSLEIIHEGRSDAPSIDVVAVGGLRPESPQCWIMSSTNEKKGSMLFGDLLKERLNARIMLFNITIKTGVVLFSPEALAQFAKLLLEELDRIRANDGTNSERVPIAFIAHDIGGLIVKEALVTAEKKRTYYNISQNCNQVVFFGTPHRAIDRVGWEDLLLKILLSSHLPSNVTTDMATRLRQYSAFLESFSARFISRCARRRIFNVYQTSEEVADPDVIVNHYSATTGLIHETNIPGGLSHENLARISGNEQELAAIVDGFTTASDMQSDYQACLSRLFELSPTLTIPNDQEELYMAEPSVEVQSAYNDWRWSAESRIITTTGNGRVGKSLNARALFRKLDKSSKVVAYFTFNTANVLCNSIQDFLASAIFQVLCRDPERFPRIKDHFTAIDTSKAWTAASLLVLFQSLLDTRKSGGLLYLIVDDVQECDSVRELVDMLAAVVSNNDSLTKLKVALFYNWLSNDNDIVKDTLQLYTQYQMHGPHLTPDTLKPLPGPLAGRVISCNPHLSNVHMRIFTALEKCKHTTEMCLMAESLNPNNKDASLRTSNSIEALINNPSTPVPNVVSSTFKSLSGLGRTMLGWIAHCKRPLSLNELATAVALTDRTANFAFKFDAKDIPLDYAAVVRSMFGPLVRFEAAGIVFSDKIVRERFLQLITEDHDRTVAEKLTTIPRNLEITKVLLEYLSWQDFVVPLNDTLRMQEHEFILPPGELFDLATYAVRLLPFHYRACQKLGEPPEPPKHRQFISTWTTLNTKLNITLSPPVPCEANMFLLAAQLGLTGIVKAEWKSATPDERRAAISLPSWGGHNDTLKQLLTDKCATDINLDIVQALEYASARGHHTTAYLISTHMCDYQRQTLLSMLGRLLCQAAKLGYEKQVPAWLGLGASVNAAPDQITALQHAAINGHARVVRELLKEKGLDMDSKAGAAKENPILLAVEKGHELVVEYLLNKKVNLECSCKDGTWRTPLWLAVEYGHEEIVRRLLDVTELGHPTLDRQNSSGVSPLMIACINSHKGIAKSLIKAGANVTLSDEKGRTALYHALSLDDTGLAIDILEKADSMDNFEDIEGVFLRATELGLDDIVIRCSNAATKEQSAQLIEYGKSTGEGRTALHHAAANSRIHIIELLLRHGAAFDPHDENGITPLGLAAEAGATDIVKLLLDRGANACVQLSDGHTILSRMAELSNDSIQHVAIVDTLIDSTNVDPNASGKNDFTALEWAIITGKVNITRALLSHRTVHRGATGRWQWNPLHTLASYSGDSTKRDSITKIAQLLIRDGIDPLEGDVDDWLPIHIASSRGNIPLLSLLWEQNRDSLEAMTNDGRTVLHFGLGSTEATEWLLERGVDKNIVNNTGCTPLMSAAAIGATSAIKLLLKYECDVGPVGRDHKTALHFAASNGETEAGRRILDKHIEILSIRDATGCSALHQAIRSGSDSFALMLLDEFYLKMEEASRCKDLDAAMPMNKETPLISAVKCRKEEVVRRLLELGADPELRDSIGKSALLSAVESSNISMLEILLDKNVANHADVNAGGGIYPTALYCAATRGNLDICKRLISLEAKVNAEGGEYNTALGAAAAQGHIPIADFLLDETEADPHLSAGEFANALSAALYSETSQLAERLLDMHVDATARDAQGRSAVHIAARRGIVKVVERIIRARGAERLVMDKQGRTITHHAAMCGDENAFLNILLVQLSVTGAELSETINMGDIDGWTPLHWACRHDGNVDIVNALIELGTHITTADKGGWFPEKIAGTHNAGKILERLRIDSGNVACSWKEGHIHLVRSCDGCFLDPIIGVAWRCEDCSNFDFCFKCYWSAKSTHDPSHTFIAIPEGMDEWDNGVGK
ncbi:ankyrin repeat-containing domain protein [Xylaria cf. heliscus]|nr:ankyrin repeat-containing domain protein [Xylaria cf. heliscus]